MNNDRLNLKSHDTMVRYIKEEIKMIIDINKSIIPIEKILKIEKDWEDKGFVKFPQNFDFKGAYMELLQWFDWDIKKYPYVDIDKDESESLYPENIHIKLEKDYSLVVLLAMVILYYCENEVSINNNNLKEIDAFITNACGCQYFVDRDSAKLYYYLEDNNIYHNDNNIHGNTASFVCGMIHNRMQNNDFEAFYKEFKSIIQKHILGNLADDSSVTTINTTATTVVEPKYIPSSDGFMEQVKTKYSYVPAAYLALQCNPVGLWYMYQQTGKYRSQFVDYNELDKSRDNMALNHIEAITKLMTKRTVYQMILQEMPEIGTDINGNTIKLKIAGYNAFKVGLLAVKDNEHVLAIIYDMANDKAQGISGDKKNVDDWIAKKLAN